METSFKRFKYRVAIPTAISFLNTCLGKRGKNNSKKNYRDPFFIVGSGRNGSTLLGSILNAHSQVFLPPEQYILGYDVMKWQLLRHKSWEAIVDEIVKDYNQEKSTCNWGVDFNDSVKTILLGLSKEEQNFANIYGVLIQFYAKQLNTTFEFYGDQSPISTHLIPRICEAFTESKFVFLIRDPRDVVLSYSKISNHPAKDWKLAVWKWNDSIKMFDYVQKKYGKEKVLILKYEDLVTNPEEKVKEVCSFLSISFEKENMMERRTDSAQKLGVENLSIHANLKKKISASSVGKWKKELSKDVISCVENETREGMLRFGYDL